MCTREQALLSDGGPRMWRVAGIMWMVLSQGFAVKPPNQSESPYYVNGLSKINEKVATIDIAGPARNGILFLGDGMSIETVTAARIRQGQLAGAQGEEWTLAWENFSHTGLSKTYNTNQQVPDSAGTITSITTGVKTKAGIIGINGSAIRSNCRSSKGNEISTLAEWAKSKGLGVGIVTTARVTHATPAGMYAHVPERNWEADSDIPQFEAGQGCKDIALQLVEWEVNGASWDVVLGGGLRNFLPNETDVGVRSDGRDLVAEWQTASGGIFVNNTLQLVNEATRTPVLGLFSAGHMAYEDYRDKGLTGEPSISQMTMAAIELLSDATKFPLGYLLLVESGRIDHAHHDGNWRKALSETVAMAGAVDTARRMTDKSDTLIVVTADHGHTTTMGGYATRGNDILGEVILNDENGNPKSEPDIALDGSTYTTLGYYNGPGAGNRTANVTNIPESVDLEYKQQTLVPLESETHGGQDVAVWASGPDARLATGQYEQNYIFFVFSHALQLQSIPEPPSPQNQNNDGLTDDQIIIIMTSTIGGLVIATLSIFAFKMYRRNRMYSALASVRAMDDGRYATFNPRKGQSQ